MADESRQQAFDREFRGHIERFREPVVASLRELISTPLPGGEADPDGYEFAVQSFEMQADWRYFPVRAFAMDRECINEADGIGAPFHGRVLPTSAGPLIPDGAIDQDGYEEAGVRTFESGARVLAEWFGECWHAAGGASFPLPAYINLHDTSRHYDLHARRWVQANEIGR
jgi:hypothetical protein